MPEPLDYANPKRRPDAVPPPAPPPVSSAAAVPVEFDTLLSRTDDHAAVTAVETALRAAKIEVYRSEDDAIAGRLVALYVHAADAERATQIATQIFVRRQRVKSLPRQQIGQQPYTYLDGLGRMILP